MDYRSRQKTFQYKGPLSQQIECYIAQKRGEGLLFNKESQMLASLDRLSLESENAGDVLTKGLVETWCGRRPNETQKNQMYRQNFIRRFAEFLLQNGNEAYCPANDRVRTATSFTPHIFTQDELQRFFYAVEHMEPSRQYRKKEIILPMLFRVLYCCGLRVSEAVNLQVKDVDLSNGVLSLLDAKFSKSRLVPVSPALLCQLRTYSSEVCLSVDPNAVFFPNARKKKHHTSEIYAFFREILWQAGISHGGKGNGPRVHDFRHTFAVHCLCQWVRNRVDINAALPYLSAYLGHTGISGTQKYTRLAVCAYPDVIQAVEAYTGTTIPMPGRWRRSENT